MSSGGLQLHRPLASGWSSRHGGAQGAEDAVEVPAARSKAASCAMGGDFFVLGGGKGFDVYGDVWRFSSEGEWTRLSQADGAIQAVNFAVAVSVNPSPWDSEGSILLTCGFRPAAHSKGNQSTAVGESEGVNSGKLLRFDVGSKLWTEVAVKEEIPGRSGHAAALVQNRFLCVCGGYDGKDKLNDLWVLDLQRASQGDDELEWVQVATGESEQAPPPMMNGAAAALGDYMYLLEGQAGAAAAGREHIRLWRIDVTDGGDSAWEEVVATAAEGHSVPKRRFGQSMVARGDSQLVVFGGSAGDVLNDDVVTFDTTDNSWRMHAAGTVTSGEKVDPTSGPHPVCFHSAALVDGGERLVVFGGSIFWEGKKSFTDAVYEFSFSPEKPAGTLSAELNSLRLHSGTADVMIKSNDEKEFPCHMAIVGSRCGPLSLQLMALVALRKKQQRNAKVMAKDLKEQILTPEKPPSTKLSDDDDDDDDAKDAPPKRGMAGAVKIMPSLPPKKQSGRKDTVKAPPKRAPPKPASKPAKLAAEMTAEKKERAESTAAAAPASADMLELAVDIPGSVVPTVLDFLYSGDVTLPAPDQDERMKLMFDLLDAAIELDLPRLAHTVANDICTTGLTMKTIIPTFLAAEAHKTAAASTGGAEDDDEEVKCWEQVRAHAEYFILDKYAEVMMVPEFTQLGPELLVNIMRLQQTALASGQPSTVPGLAVIPASTLEADLVSLHEDMDYADFTLGAGAGGGEKAECHRCILAARSTFFAAAFAESPRVSGTWAEGSIGSMPLQVGDWMPPARVAQQFVQFLYTDLASADITVQDSVFLVSMCDYYGVTGLRLLRHCEHLIEQGVTKDNALELLALANTTGNRELIDLLLAEVTRPDWFGTVGAQRAELEKLPKALLLTIIVGASSSLGTDS